jgi:hypothetical protein
MKLQAGREWVLHPMSDLWGNRFHGEVSHHVSRAWGQEEISKVG